MNKTRELAILDRAITELGDASYLGPWLASIRAEIGALLASDVLPEISLAVAKDRAGVIVGDANEVAAAKKSAAERYALQIVSQARTEAQQIKDAALSGRIQLAGKLEEAARLLRIA